MSQACVSTVGTVDRDCAFAAMIVGVQCPVGEQDGMTRTTDGNVMSDAACALLSQVKTQQPSQAILPETAVSRREAVVLISFVHAETIADAKSSGAFNSDREAHVWMTAVLLYDKFHRQAASLTAWIDMDPFRPSQNPRLTKTQLKARLQPTSPHYWMLSVAAEHHLAAERHCDNLFALACYSIAFKWESNEVTIPFKNLEKSLVRFSQQFGKQTFKSRPGAMDTAELIFLDTLKWDVCVDGPLVHIDNLLWNAGITQKKSALLSAAYEHATHLVLDPKMLSDRQYSPFYTACVCVLQACNDSATSPESVFGSSFIANQSFAAQTTASDASAVFGCV
jgi:hypothetical protein